ncbi:hypothetical protein [Dysgonomonas sp. PH5-45]|nr:hypothetical protein [Dysgonomonas sp. PH5-45]
MIINDYILEFSDFNGPPDAILIQKRENHGISIKDLPKNTSLGYLRKSMRKEEDLGAGVFSNVLCIYYLDEIGEDKIIFKDVPSKLQKKAEQIHFSLTLSGKEISIPYDVAEWEPSLEIKYDLNSQKKIVNNYAKRIEKTVDFFI